MNSLPFRCPACGTALPDLASHITGLKCPGCPAIYPVQDGLINFLPSSVPARTLAQAAMEAEPIVRIYESRLWRRSSLFALATRISFACEQEMIFAAAGLQDGQTVLDLACGPGIYSRPMAGKLTHGLVIGLDLSPAMLEHARRLAVQAQLSNLVLIRANAAFIPIQPRTMDAVICCGALHLFPDPGAILAETFKTLKPGGRIVLAVFRRGESAAAAFRDKLRRSLYGVTSFTAAELKSLLEAGGFQEVQYHHAGGLWMIASAGKAL